VCNKAGCHYLYHVTTWRATQEANILKPQQKYMGTAQAAQKTPCPEGTLRRLDKKGIVNPVRDRWGRRLFGDDDVEAARAHLQA
jgi:hypothetical protein